MAQEMIPGYLTLRGSMSACLNPDEPICPGCKHICFMSLNSSKSEKD